MNQPHLRNLLIAEFGSALIPVTSCCHLFGMSKTQGTRAASTHSLPVPTFRIGSQKSPWLISIESLAKLVHRRQLRAEKEWKAINSA